MRLSKRFTGFAGISLSCVAFLISNRFICSNRVEEKRFIYIDIRYHFFGDRDTRMIFIFLYSLYGIRLSHIFEIPSISNEKPSISIEISIISIENLEF